MARPSTTLIYASRRTVARADFYGASPGDIATRPRPDAPDLPSAVELALTLGPAVGKRVFVLATDVWTQTLGLPSAKAAGLNETDLANALNFEAETHSGMSALEASVAHVALPPLPGSRDLQFWLTQIASADCDFINEIVEREGSRLGGIVHPGGLTAALTPKLAVGPFGRIELWPDAVVGVWKPPSGAPTVRIWNTDAASDRWHAEVDQWRDATGAAERFEWLRSEGISPPSGIGANLSLDDEAGLASFLGAWAKMLIARRLPIPAVRPSKPPMPANRRWVIAGGLALAVAAGCFAHWKLTEMQIASHKSEQEAEQAKVQKLDAARKAVDAKIVERDKIRAERARLETMTAKLNNRRERFARLLELLSSTKPDDVLIRSIDHEHGHTRLVGLTLRPELADAFARSLYESMHKLGWEVQSPKETATPSARGEALWSFELVIRDVVEPKAPPKPATSGR